MSELELRSCIHCRQPIAGDARVCMRCRKSALVDLFVVHAVEDPRLLYQAARAVEPLLSEAAKPKAQALLATPGARLAAGLTPGVAGAWTENLARLGIGIRQLPASGEMEDAGGEALALAAPEPSRAPMAWIVGGVIASLATAVFILWPRAPSSAGTGSAPGGAPLPAATPAAGPFIWSAGFDEASDGEIYVARVVMPAPSRPAPAELLINVMSTAKGATAIPLCSFSGSVSDWRRIDLEALRKGERWNPGAALPGLVVGDTQLYFGVLRFPWVAACPREGNLRATELELVGADPRWARVGLFKNEGQFALLPTVDGER
jgi:hypothetical protein